MWPEIEIPPLSDQAFSSVGESRWPFSRPSLAPLGCDVTHLPRKQNLRTCLPNTRSWDSAASEVLQGRGDESVLLLILSGGPDTRREAGVSGFEGDTNVAQNQPTCSTKMAVFRGHPWWAQKVNLRRATAASRREKLYQDSGHE